MGRSLIWASSFLLLATSVAFGQGRVWTLAVTRLDGCNVGGCTGGWTQETSGGYVSSHPQSGKYWWATAQNDSFRRAWWKFEKGNDAFGGGANFVTGTGLTTDDPPEQPRLYFVRTWVPPAHSSTFSVLEADVLGPDNPDPFPIDPRIPWVGAAGTNHQYIKRNPSNQGNWVAVGPGPDHGIVATQNGLSVYSAACGTGAGSNGLALWLRKGDWLYVKWDFGNPGLTQGVSAIEITEANAIPPGLPAIATCSTATCRGPVDLRCMGNADPLYGVGASNWWDSADREPLAEPRSGTKAYGVDDWSLAADGYRRPCTSTTTLSPGVPANGSYTAHLLTGDVTFQLRYEGRNSFKWDTGETNPASPFFKDRVFTLNEVSATQFAVRPYNKLYLLSTKNGDNSQLNVQLVYSDSSTSTTSVALHDWFNQDGDGTTSIAVGSGGTRRNDGGIGFKRVKGNDDSTLSIQDGTASGAFFFVNPIDVDPSKNLSQIKLSVSPDGRDPCLTGCGNAVVFAATLVSSTCVFDVAGGLPDGSVDMNDFGGFQECYTGSLTVDPFSCICMDVTHDTHVDHLDFAYFLNCATGASSGTPPLANCDVAP